jgi:hypothetical protein
MIYCRKKLEVAKIYFVSSERKKTVDHTKNGRHFSTTHATKKVLAERERERNDCKHAYNNNIGKTARVAAT